MEKIKTYLKSVEDSVSSVFLKEDVLKILRELDREARKELGKDLVSEKTFDLNEFKEELIDEIYHLDDFEINQEEVEFIVIGQKIVPDYVPPVPTSDIAEQIIPIIDKLIEKVRK
jgi:hypothetical protein